MKAVLRRVLHSVGPLHRALARYRGTLIHQPEKISQKASRLGSDYGGWSFLPEHLGPDAVVYSVGIGSDISFDIGLISQFGCHVHGFDPTPNASAWIKKQALPPKFHYHAVGLAASDGEAAFLKPEIEGWDSFGTITDETPENRIVRCPVKRLSTIAAELGHDRIDLLKMDIEGFEYQVLDDIFSGNVVIDQILVEFHHTMYSHTPKDTRDAVDKLRSAGYILFNLSNVGHEYSFVRAALLT
jgi:FkbM family methyltransferase